MARRATWVLALAPPAIAASMAYTEGIALGLSVTADAAIIGSRIIQEIETVGAQQAVPSVAEFLRGVRGAMDAA